MLQVDAGGGIVNESRREYSIQDLWYVEADSTDVSIKINQDQQRNPSSTCKQR